MFVSSTGHSVAATFDAENIESTEEGYKRLGTYNTTKLYNVSFQLQNITLKLKLLK